MSDLTKWKVHGPVHTLRTEFAEWDLSLEQWQPARPPIFSRFHPDGRIRESEFHNPDGSISRSTYAYDSVGLLQEVRFEMDRAPPSKMIYSYDERGWQARVVGVDRDGTERELDAYSYGQDGKKTKVYFVPRMEPNTGFGYSIEGTEHSYGATDATTITTRYDDRGQPDEVLFSDEGHRVLRRVVFTRDGAGLLLKEEMHLDAEIPFLDTEKQLQNMPPDERDRAAAAFAKLFGPNHVMSSTTYAYDAKGRLLERHSHMGGLGDDRTTFRYDDRDNPIEQTTEHTTREMNVDEEGRLQTTKEDSHTQTARFEYAYDAQGNWTEQVVWSRLEPNPNFQRLNVSRREITYYV